jgi:hypothetical protein
MIWRPEYSWCSFRKNQSNYLSLVIFQNPTSHRPSRDGISPSNLRSSIIFGLHAINMGNDSPPSRHFRRQQRFKNSIEQRCCSELMRFLILGTTMLARLSASHMCGVSLYSIKHPKQNPDYFQPLLVSKCSKSRSNLQAWLPLPLLPLLP